ncbi:MAG: dihydroxyacetone kinase subunit DhaK [Clostridiales bacterium]|nr:dihydroxyacetone kinase subunit DhaK [Clostridiales bacterium]MDY4007720.1 dihydroxyacetone kinase subunit DhaK [Candidatus Limiplasma sp.]
MKKCMNHPQQFVDDSLQGILMAYRGFYQSGNDDLRAIIHPTQNANVRIITGGGYGHLPVFLGYVGNGLCDGAAVGNVFTSPSCEAILNATRALKPQNGVLYLFGNYFGDSMNFEMACETLAQEGIETEIVKMSDDIASAPRSEYENRRGIAGIFFSYKIAGACASAGLGLQEVARVAKDTVANTASFGVAFSSCTLPEHDQPIFTLGKDEMEIGMGIHGEPGVRHGTMQSSECIANELCTAVAEDLALREGERIAVLVNGLGATSREELYIFYRDIDRILQSRGLITAKAFVGEYATSMEMSGLSLSLLRLNNERENYLNAAAYTPFVSF